MLNLEEMEPMTVSGKSIFQTRIFMFNCKNQTVTLLFQNLFVIKPRSKYTIRTTNMLLESLCRRKFSVLKIYLRGSHQWNKLIAPNVELSKIKKLFF